MASRGNISPGRMSEQDSLIESNRMSLYDVVEDRNRAMNKKSLIHRYVVVAQFYNSVDDKNEAGAYYDKFFKDNHATMQGEMATGLLLLYPNLCVFVIETSSEMFTEFVKEVFKDKAQGHGIIKQAKICVISHDISQRLYQTFITKVLDIQAPNIDELDPNEAVEPTVIEVLTQLLKLGNYLAKQPKSTEKSSFLQAQLNLKSALATMREKVPDFLPQQDAIGQIVVTNDTCVMTIEEYLELYQKPIKITLDSEMAWPMPVRLFPYN